MKNDIVRFENNVPDNYLIGSRDYQALLRLFTFGINSVKFDVDNIKYINDASHINSRLLNLLKLKVGFFTKEEFQDQYIREVLKVFSLILKKKGTRQAIYDAINLYFRACRYNGDYVVEIINKDAVTPYKVRIGITKESKDILLLEEILKYILPTGYLYEVFKYSTAKYRSNYYSQDILTLSVVDDYNGSNIHSNSSNVFIEKLYEGISVGPASIITITDGADNTPLKSAVVNIEPVQDLHGYDYPWPAGGGKNKFDQSTITSITTGVEYQVHLEPNTEYTMSTTHPLSANNAAFVFFKLSGQYDSTGANGVWNNHPHSLTTGADGIAIIMCRTLDGETLQTFLSYKYQVEEGSTATAFAPYSNICPISGWTQVDVWVKPTYDTTLTPTATIPLGRTVYGGTLDVLRGKLNAKPYYASYSGQSLVGPWISSHDKYVAGATPTTGAQVVDMGAAGTDYDVTPQTIKTLLGVNNIWADAGEMSIEYLSETSGGSYITYYNVYNNVTDDYINILTYPSVNDIELYNGDFTVSISEADFDLDNANMYVLIHQYLKDDRIVCSNTTWSISYDAQTDSITATSGNNEINISYSNFIRNLPLLEDHEIPSSFTLEYENESINTQRFVLQDDNRSFTFTGYDGNKIIVKYETDSQYLGKRIDNVVVYKNGWENESD